MKKLAFYTNMPTPYQIDFFDALKDQFDMTVIYYTTREKDRTWSLPVTNDLYKVIVLKNSMIAKLVQKRVASFHFSWQIIKVLLRSKAEFVVINGTYWSPNVILALLISKFKGKLVFYWSEPLFPEKNRWQFYTKYILLSPVRIWSDALLAIGQNAISCFKKYGYKRPMHNIPYNIDVNAFDISRLNPGRLQELKEKYKRNGEVVFITSGALVERKGVDTLIKAFLQLPDSLNTKLLILGDGPERKAYEQLASSSDRIHFLGFCEKDEVPYYFVLSDIFVFASRYDGWALVVNEAAAAELAIICSDMAGAATDKLTNGVNALICAANDVDGFAAAMLKCASDNVFRNQLVKNIRLDKQYFSSGYVAKELNGIFSSYQ